MGIAYKYRSSYQEVLLKKISVLEILGILHGSTHVVRSCFNKIARPMTGLKKDSTTVAFLGIFQNL